MESPHQPSLILADFRGKRRRGILFVGGPRLQERRRRFGPRIGLQSRSSLGRAPVFRRDR